MKNDNWIIYKGDMDFISTLFFTRYSNAKKNMSDPILVFQTGISILLDKKKISWFTKKKKAFFWLHLKVTKMSTTISRKLLGVMSRGSMCVSLHSCIYLTPLCDVSGISSFRSLSLFPRSLSHSLIYSMVILKKMSYQSLTYPLNDLRRMRGKTGIAGPEREKNKDVLESIPLGLRSPVLWVG